MEPNKKSTNYVVNDKTNYIIVNYFLQGQLQWKLLNVITDNVIIWLL